jgi:hypothetical protein
MHVILHSIPRVIKHKYQLINNDLLKTEASLTFKRLRLLVVQAHTLLCVLKTVVTIMWIRNVRLWKWKAESSYTKKGNRVMTCCDVYSSRYVEDVSNNGCPNLKGIPVNDNKVRELILEGPFIMNLYQLDKQSTKFTIWKYWKGCMKKLEGNDPSFLPTTRGSCITTMHLLTLHCLWGSF